MKPSSQRKRKAKKQSVEQSYVVQKTFVSLGMVFQRSVNLRKITQTDLKGFPNRVIVGFSNQRNLVMFEYDSLSDHDSDSISGFFSNLKSGDSFEIPKGLGEWTDGTQKKSDILAGTYKFRKYKNSSFIIAEKDKPFSGEMYQKVLLGRHFLRPLQFSKDRNLNSNKTLSKILNYVNAPSFTTMGLDVGSVIKIEGSQGNNSQFTILQMNSVDGLEEMVVTPQISIDEDRIGMETKINLLTVNKKSPQGVTANANISQPLRGGDEFNRRSPASVTEPAEIGRNIRRQTTNRNERPPTRSRSTRGSGGGGGGSSY